MFRVSVERFTVSVRVVMSVSDSVGLALVLVSMPGTSI